MAPDGSSSRSTISDPTTERWGLGEAWIGVAASLVVSNVIGAVVITIAGWRSTEEIPMWGLGVLQIPLWAGYLAAVVVAARKGSGVSSAFGAHIRALDAPIGLVVGIASQLLLLPLLYYPIFELTGTDSEELSRPAQQLASRAGGTVSWLLFALLVGLIAPVVEELFFRGLLLRSLQKRGMRAAGAVVVSAVIFASLHLQLLQFPGLLLFGLVAAGLAVGVGRLGISIFAHIGFNMTTVAVLYLDYRGHLP